MQGDGKGWVDLPIRSPPTRVFVRFNSMGGGFVPTPTFAPSMPRTSTPPGKRRRVRSSGTWSGGGGRLSRRGEQGGTRKAPPRIQFRNRGCRSNEDRGPTPRGPPPSSDTTAVGILQHQDGTQAADVRCSADGDGSVRFVRRSSLRRSSTHASRGTTSTLHPRLPCTRYPFSSIDPRPVPDEDAVGLSHPSSAGCHPRPVCRARPVFPSVPTRDPPFRDLPIPLSSDLVEPGEKARGQWCVHVSSIALPAPPPKP